MADWTHKGETRNHLDILISRESKTCAGCLHKGAIWSQPWRLKQDKPAKKKCAKYMENE